MAKIWIRPNEKLDDAEAAVGELSASNHPSSYRRSYDRALAAIREALWSLQSETIREAKRSKQRGDAVRWFNALKEEMDDDQLMRWARTARDSTTHEGSPSLIMEAYSENYLNFDDFDAPDGASFVLDASGPEWVLDQGTTRERRVAARPRQGTRSAAAPGQLWVRITDPPRAHKGEQLSTTEPAELLTLAIAYCRDVIDRAVERFGGSEVANDE